MLPIGSTTKVGAYQISGKQHRVASVTWGGGSWVDSTMIERTSLMFVTTGPEVDDFYLRFILRLHQNVLLKLAGQCMRNSRIAVFFLQMNVSSLP